jgi:putative hydrolase of the HAD superfamily
MGQVVVAGRGLPQRSHRFSEQFLFSVTGLTMLTASFVRSRGQVRFYDDVMSLNHLDGIRAVVFDAVGTILEPDPKPAVVYSEIGGRHGSRLTDAVIATGFREAFDAQEQRDLTRHLATDETRELARWRAIVGSVLHDVADSETCFRELWEHFAASTNWKLIPGAGELLAALRKRDLKLAVASNFDGRLRSVLAGFPESRLLHDIVISSEVGWRKPAAEFFAALCRRLAYEPSEILFVGDNRGNDYDGARKAGLRALLLDPTAQYAQSDCRRIEKLADLLENRVNSPA